MRAEGSYIAVEGVHEVARSPEAPAGRTVPGEDVVEERRGLRRSQFARALGWRRSRRGIGEGQFRRLGRVAEGGWGAGSCRLIEEGGVGVGKRVGMGGEGRMRGIVRL